ncbi:MAG: alpha/beta hydrolase [SAR86 cluster bacterium]|uniref:Alpha/beta hydrolase n=1 Tax=SAR86 cluster bacterium TaxID=2030880 RepID=A0A2A4X6C8_9GAMM|nr:MAG: alpha/beta hydrolase [SAR86 cluster bacterium]
MKKSLCLLISLLVASVIQANELYDAFPKDIHEDQRYVFYSHGLIVEGQNSRPVHPEFGIYDFPAIAQAIFKNGEFNLIAHHRPQNTDMFDYADQLVSWVDQLLQAGVSPSRISLVGFSRGGQITALASNSLKDTGINTAIMAICSNGDFRIDQPLEFGGNVLSIYETSDVVTSCNLLLERSTDALSTKEVSISTGKKHGAFYTPLQEWIMPLKGWLKETNR